MRGLTPGKTSVVSLEVSWMNSSNSVCIKLKTFLSDQLDLCHSTLGRGWLWNSQRPCQAVHKGVSYKVRVCRVFVLTFDVEVEILHRENVGGLSTDGEYRVIGEHARWNRQIRRPDRYGSAVCGYLPLVVADEANLQ